MQQVELPVITVRSRMRAAHVVRKAKTIETLQQKAGEYTPKVSIVPEPGYDV
jgi:hypothetical protein